MFTPIHQCEYCYRAIGGQVWLDTKGELTHVGSHDFVGRPQARFGAPVKLQRLVG